VNYKQSKQWLEKYINWEVKTPEAAELNLVSIKNVLHKLNNPQNSYPNIHIAGSKGKGSTAAICAYCLKCAGLKVGLLTSPHLIDVRERVRILTPTDELGWIPEQDFSEIITDLLPVLEEYKPSYFEILTVLAFEHFRRQQVDIAVIEVGLGGKTDATNVVNPLVSIITSISLEHTHILGNTLTEITQKKAGIIKPKVPVVTARQEDEVLEEIYKTAKEKNSTVILPSLDTEHFVEQSDVALLGDHQYENASLAVTALQEVQSIFPTLTDSAIKQGLETVKWPGRFQVLQEANKAQPGILVDGAHNNASMQCLLQTLEDEYPNINYHFLFGVNKGKSIKEMYVLIKPKATSVTFTQSNHPKAMSTKDVAAVCDVNQAEEYSPEQALNHLKQTISPGELIVVTGSLYVVGEVL
jgi:dihydrofolate synthase/folylpolyglutamate synthase